jgi:antitoxin component of RelBE/YafQ-DinJ toxin-antitoxin module
VAANPNHSPVVGARLDPDTAAALKRAAAERGLTLTDVVRDILTRTASVSAPVPLRRRYVPGGAELTAVAAELGKIGGNLQRLYTMASTAGYPADAAAFASARDDVRKVAAAVLAVVGGPRDEP